MVRPQLIDGFLPKVEERIERSNGKLRADIAHDKLVAVGFAGSERTTRRAVAAVKKNYGWGGYGVPPVGSPNRVWDCYVEWVRRFWSDVAVGFPVG